MCEDTSKLSLRNAETETPMMAISEVRWAGMPDMREDANMQSLQKSRMKLQR
jgi:hypothetical protein